MRISDWSSDVCSSDLRDSVTLPSMCGRDSFFATWAEVRRFSLPLTISAPTDDPPPTWNRAPTQTGWAIVARDDCGEAVPMRWGLVPPWAKDTKTGRSEEHTSELQSLMSISSAV